MLDNESLWEAAARCHQILGEAQIPYCVCGGVAVCLHGYQRNTTDIDLIVNGEDSGSVKDHLISEGLIWNEQAHEFLTQSGIAVQFLLAGESAGRGMEVKIAEPVGDDNVEVIEGLTVVRLSKLIEMKLACGAANLRRTHKDYADVVELIAIRKLDGAFSRHLHKAVRKTYRELVHHAQG